MGNYRDIHYSSLPPIFSSSFIRTWHGRIIRGTVYHAIKYPLCMDSTNGCSTDRKAVRKDLEKYHGKFLSAEE